MVVGLIVIWQAHSASHDLHCLVDLSSIGGPNYLVCPNSESFQGTLNYYYLGGIALIIFSLSAFRRYPVIVKGDFFTIDGQSMSFADVAQIELAYTETPQNIT